IEKGLPSGDGCGHEVRSGPLHGAVQHALSGCDDGCTRAPFRPGGHGAPPSRAYFFLMRGPIVSRPKSTPRFTPCAVPASASETASWVRPTHVAPGCRPHSGGFDPKPPRPPRPESRLLRGTLLVSWCLGGEHLPERPPREPLHKPVQAAFPPRGRNRYRHR